MLLAGILGRSGALGAEAVGVGGPASMAFWSSPEPMFILDQIDFYRVYAAYGRNPGVVNIMMLIERCQIEERPAARGALAQRAVEFSGVFECVYHDCLSACSWSKSMRSSWSLRWKRHHRLASK